MIYLVFNEGYTATSGDHWIRTDLCGEALRLGRMLAALVPSDTETLGLLALIELQASRLRARTGADGGPVLLLDQDRSRWDRLLIQRGLANIDRSSTSAAPSVRTPCRRRSRPATRGPRSPRTPTGKRSPRCTTASPGSAHHRSSSSTAVSRPHRPSARGGAGDRAAVVRCPGMRRLPPVYGVAGDLLCRSGEHEQAREHFLRAAAMTQNKVERTTMQHRAAQCAAGHS